MDNNEATSTLMMRIQGLDPENACKIMGYILIQDPGEKEMIRLALGPETLLINLINKAKSYLGISSNTSSAPSSPSVFNPLRRTQTSPRIIIPTPPSSPWPGFSPKPPASLPSYAAAVVHGTANFESTEEYTNAQDKLFFETKNINFMDPVMSPSARSDSIVFPFDNCSETHHHNNLHRRSFSVSDVYQSDDDSNGEWRPCMYFARGFCKNGSNCKYLHLSSPDAAFSGSPKMDGFDDFLRYKAIQQQRFMASSQLMAGGGGASRFPYNRCMNFHSDDQRSAAAALMMGEEYHKFVRGRANMNDFGFGGNPDSIARQIYLTFPADSEFKEDDVSRYFCTYGPVQDVRMPYQQKRMFGFVTFVYPETVKQILAHGNPHFVCNSRVLVKPYKEKGKFHDKKQHIETGEFPECSSPSGLDLGEPYDLPFGGRVVYNSHEMMLRRKLQEQTHLQQAIECHERRLMNFQLLDLPNRHPNLQLRPHIVAAAPTHSPTQSHAYINQNLLFLSDDINGEFLEGSSGDKDEATSPTDTDQKILHEVDESGHNSIVNAIDNDKGERSNPENYDHHGSLEHIFPDNLFASPTKLASECNSLFCADSGESDGSNAVTATPLSSNNVPVLPTTSNLSFLLGNKPLEGR